MPNRTLHGKESGVNPTPPIATAVPATQIDDSIHVDSTESVVTPSPNSMGIILTSTIPGFSVSMEQDRVRSSKPETIKCTQTQDTTIIVRKWLDGNELALAGYILGICLWYIILVVILLVDILEGRLILIFLVPHSIIGVWEIWHALKLACNCTTVTLNTTDIAVEVKPCAFCPEQCRKFPLESIKEVSWQRHESSFFSLASTDNNSTNTMVAQQPNVTYAVMLTQRDGKTIKILGHPVVQCEQEAVFIKSQMERHVQNSSVVVTVDVDDRI